MLEIKKRNAEGAENTEVFVAVVTMFSDKMYACVVSTSRMHSHAEHGNEGK